MLVYNDGQIRIEKIIYENVNELFTIVKEKLIDVNSQPAVVEGIVGGSCSRVNVDYQKGRTLYLWPEFKEYLNFIKPYIRNYIKDLGQSEEDYYVSDMWTNRYPPGTFIVRHKHPNIYDERPALITKNEAISIVLGIRKPKNSGNLVIEIPNELNEITEYEVFSEEGEVILFPGALFHKTSPNQSDEDKFTIVLELILKSCADSQANTTITLDDI